MMLICSGGAPDPRASRRGGVVCSLTLHDGKTIGRDPSGVEELICHNDLAPWNLIVGEQNWAFIDWDLAAPGRRLWDLDLPVCTFVPLWLEQPADMRHYHTFCSRTANACRPS